MDFIFILIAFVCGLSIKLTGLPPLIGFLLAGFVLNYLGYESNSTLDTLASLGITLMLFTIGLKLNIRDLLKREVLLGSSLHLAIWVVLITCCFYFLMILGVGYFASMTLQTCAIIAFALSFSSTVCIVKILDESGEVKTRHGKVTIGILVMQDIFAVLFLVVAMGKVPSVWSLALLLLFFAKPIWSIVLEKAGHGELLPLTGFFIAIGGYQLFELVGIKGDLGALIIGMLIAGHSKSSELSKALMSFKDLFLIGFFLSIGFTALPDLNIMLTALALCFLLPIKFGLFFSIFTRLRLRARTSYLSSLVLGNYSEFGLIVVALLVNMNLLDKNWLVILAIAVSISFLFTSLMYKNSHNQYTKVKSGLKRFEHPNRLKEDVYSHPLNARVLIIGMGRVGKGAYGALNNVLYNEVWGMDADPIRIAKLRKSGMQVMVGDGEDADFWENFDLSHTEIVMLAVPSVEDISNITQQLRSANYSGTVASIARYEDEIELLQKAGADKVFNFFTEAGTGFAEESLQMLAMSQK
ncbi:cation:proton antiporter family protein [Aliiglaciecola sp. LCG003]|uniref:cation:proton antiporter family protein n=1 Tax=Aliiglaciecola sp. LCG003 TaxID=3053655 RepID=UPI0025739576|nr:cation:proton antiporter family protein [Aliiglaciecola sp. LCG003]WJG07613.1 cation:proton antiporter [Aliiglaciecola sp. LCG003]